MSDLLNRQMLFSYQIAKFKLDLWGMGFKTTEGESYRPKETAELYERQGKGSANSLHCIKLACDLNIFKGGNLLQTKEELTHAGTLWESYSTKDLTYRWGGNFQKIDADHFSLVYEGRA